MLIDRSAPEDVFAPVPELAGQTDPELKALDALLDDDQLFGQVKADLARRFPHTTDRGSGTAFHASGSHRASLAGQTSAQLELPGDGRARGR